MRYRIVLTPKQLAELLANYHQIGSDPPLITLLPGLQVLKDTGKLSDYQVDPKPTDEH